MPHPDAHRSHRISWLRAAVLGANDGIVSTASLVIGVAAAQAGHGHIMLAGIAGLVAGTMSMAAGEYVSVSSQSDTEKAELELELLHLKENPEYEMDELTEIYIKRGLDVDLAYQVAKKLTEHDALAAHARDELGIFDRVRARPIEAALYSAISFASGAALPLIVANAVTEEAMIFWVASMSLVFLALLGGVAARAGGAPVGIGAARVTFWGAMAMVLTALVGDFLGVVL